MVKLEKFTFLKMYFYFLRSKESLNFLLQSSNNSLLKILLCGGQMDMGNKHYTIWSYKPLSMNNYLMKNIFNLASEKCLMNYQPIYLIRKMFE